MAMVGAEVYPVPSSVSVIESIKSYGQRVGGATAAAGKVEISNAISHRALIEIGISRAGGVRQKTSFCDTPETHRIGIIKEVGLPAAAGRRCVDNYIESNRAALSYSLDRR